MKVIEQELKISRIIATLSRKKHTKHCVLKECLYICVFTAHKGSAAAAPQIPSTYNTQSVCCVCVWGPHKYHNISKTESGSAAHTLAH